MVNISTIQAGSSAEQMYVSGLISSDHTKSFEVLVVYSALTAEQKTVYNNFKILLTNNAYASLTNIDEHVSIERITSEEVTVDSITIDFSTLLPAEQSKIADFKKLVEFLATNK